MEQTITQDKLKEEMERKKRLMGLFDMPPPVYYPKKIEDLDYALNPNNYTLPALASDYPLQQVGADPYNLSTMPVYPLPEATYDLGELLSDHYKDPKYSVDPAQEESPYTPDLIPYESEYDRDQYSKQALSDQDNITYLLMKDKGNLESEESVARVKTLVKIIELENDFPKEKMRDYDLKETEQVKNGRILQDPRLTEDDLKYNPEETDLEEMADDFYSVQSISEVIGEEDIECVDGESVLYVESDAESSE